MTTTSTSLRDAVATYIRRSLVWMQEWRAAERAEYDQLVSEGGRLVNYRDVYRAWMLPWGPVRVPALALRLDRHQGLLHVRGCGRAGSPQ
jgi:hypothetical protein